MTRLMLTPLLQTVVVLLAASTGHPQATHRPAGQPVSTPRPLLLEKDEGELRTRRPRPQPSPASQFMLKVGPRLNGSERLVVGTEQIAPGASIPVHKHPQEDEIVLIHSGTAHVWLGDQERDLHAGGLVFIPADTWIGLKNTSHQPLELTFVFSAPGFDDFQTCISVPAGQPAPPMTQQDLLHCEQAGHMVYKNRSLEQRLEQK